MSDYTPAQLRTLDWLIAVHIFHDHRHIYDGGVADIRGPNASLPAEAYTTDWEYAGRVLEWLAQRTEALCIDAGTESWGVESDKYDIVAPTLPLAICLHALQVAGVDVEKEVTG